MGLDSGFRRNDGMVGGGREKKGTGDNKGRPYGGMVGGRGEMDSRLRGNDGRARRGK